MHPQDGGLRWVDDGSAEERSEGSSIGYGEGSPLHLLYGQSTVLGLLSKQSYALLHVLHTHTLHEHTIHHTKHLLLSLTAKLIFSQFLKTGTTNPVGEATATDMST